MSKIRDVMAVQGEAFRMISVLRRRYEQKIGRWESPIENFGVAFKDAVETHHKAVDAHYKIKQADLDAAFAILGLVCGLAVGWIAVALKNNSSKYVFYKKLLESEMPDYVGDIGKVIDWSVGQGLDKIKSELEPSAGDKKAGLSLESPRQFAQSVVNVFRAQRNRVLKTIDALGLKIHEDSSFSEKILDYARGDLKRAKELISQMQERLEEQWFGDCFYYQNRPTLPSMSDMQKIIEQELWAEWLQKNIKIHDNYWKKDVQCRIGNVPKNQAIQYCSDITIENRPEKPILERLKWCGVINHTDYIKLTDEAYLKTARGRALNKEYRDQVSKSGYGIESPLHTIARKEVRGRMLEHFGDSYEKVFRDLMNWAKNHKSGVIGITPVRPGKQRAMTSKKTAANFARAKRVLAGNLEQARRMAA